MTTSLHPDVTSLHPDFISFHPDVTSLHPDVTSLHPDVISLHPDINLHSLTLYPKLGFPTSLKFHSEIHSYTIFRLPRIDGSLDRSRKPRFGSIGRNEDLDRLRENYDDVTGGDFVRPMMRNKFTPTPPPGGASVPTNGTRANRDGSTNRDGKPRFQTDVKALIRTYKKVAYL